MAEEGGRTVPPRGCPPAPPALGPGLTLRVPPDVRFVTEESFDFGLLSPSDSREEEEEEEEEGSPPGARGGSGRWSPLSGARLEEMVREATRLAAQLERCHLPPPAPPGPRTPRSPRRETFVVKDSPVRALLPTVEPGGSPPAAARSPAKRRGVPAATTVPAARKVSSSCHPTAAPKGPPSARVPPPSRVAPPRPCPPQGQGAGTRGKSEPPRGGTAGQPKARGGAAPCPPPAARQPRARATTIPSSRPPAPSAIPRAPGRTPAGGAAAGGRAPRGKDGCWGGRCRGYSPPRASVSPCPIAALPSAGAGAARAAPPAAGAGCKPGPPPSRLRPPRKTAVNSTPR
ncbi:proline/serine-rich coiled-coil protein 1 [Rhynochetos jubatus]